jgi:hypothetical protein
LVCTDNKRYATLRKSLGKESKTTQLAIVSTISTATTPYIGITAASAIPFVTLWLMALLQVGANAWCAGQIE